MPRVLIIDDDEKIAEYISADLQQIDSSYHMTCIENGREALNLASDSIDLILLDIMLAEENGIEICPLLRAYFGCPIIFMSCLDDSDTIVQAFENGGDDYICKPFDPKVLHARIMANLRRVGQLSYSAGEKKLSANYSLNADNYTVTIQGKTVALLPIEFRILSFLMEHEGEFFKSSDLYRMVWGADSFGDTRTVLVHIHNIRQKLKDDAENPRLIRNERGRGYAFFFS